MVKKNKNKKKISCAENLRETCTKISLLVKLNQPNALLLWFNMRSYPKTTRVLSEIQPDCANKHCLQPIV